MSEYYSKEKVMNKFDAMLRTLRKIPRESNEKDNMINECLFLKQAINSLSIEEVSPIIHAKWIETGYCGPHDMFIVQCSNCQIEFESDVNDNYCPNCGAKMDG